MPNRCVRQDLRPSQRGAAGRPSACNQAQARAARPRSFSVTMGRSVLRGDPQAPDLAIIIDMASRETDSTPSPPRLSCGYEPDQVVADKLRVSSQTITVCYHPNALKACRCTASVGPYPLGHAIVDPNLWRSHRLRLLCRKFSITCAFIRNQSERAQSLHASPRRNE